MHQQHSNVNGLELVWYKTTILLHSRTILMLILV